MGPTIEREQLDRSIGAMLDDRADAGGIDHIDVERVLDSCGERG